MEVMCFYEVDPTTLAEVINKWLKKHHDIKIFNTVQSVGNITNYYHGENAKASSKTNLIISIFYIPNTLPPEVKCNRKDEDVLQMKN